MRRWCGLIAVLVTSLGSSQAIMRVPARGVAVQWLDTIAYRKPIGIAVIEPTIVTNYWIDMTNGSDSSTCGTSTANACATLRGIICGSCGTARNLVGLRGNAGDGAAAINIKGTGDGSFFSFDSGSGIDNGIRGTSGKEVLIRPWCTSPCAAGSVVFNRGNQNQGINGTQTSMHDIIIDGGDPLTGTLVFKWVANFAGNSQADPVLNVQGARITVFRNQFTSNGATGTGWVDLVFVQDADGDTSTDIAFYNNEFYDCNTGANQCSAVYTGPCTANGGCAVNNFTFKGNIVRNVGGEGLELNPRVLSSTFLIEDNVFYHVGFATCGDGGFRSCRPALTLNINQSGSLNDVTIRNNLIWDVSSGCIWDNTGSTGTHAPQIYGNTCVDFGKGTLTNGRPEGISQAGSTSTAFIQDNVIWATNGTDPFGASGASYQARSFNGLGSGKTGGTNNVTIGATSFVTTTVNDVAYLSIDSSSPAYHTGTSIATLTTDYRGGARPSPPSIGAVEF